MIIAIPVDDDRKKVCVAFGRAPEFLWFDSETQTIGYVTNPGAEAQGGAGMKAAQCILDLQTDVLITPRCGENAAQVMKEAEVHIYKSQHELAADDLAAFANGELSLLTSFHGGYIGIL